MTMTRTEVDSGSDRGGHRVDGIFAWCTQQDEMVNKRLVGSRGLKATQRGTLGPWQSLSKQTWCLEDKI